jgi:hypothetical protein
MIQGVVAARCLCVVARVAVGEGREGECARVKKRRCETPWLIAGGPRCRVLIGEDRMANTLRSGTVVSYAQLAKAEKISVS